MRILSAALAGGVAYLACIFIGGLLVTTAIPLVVFVGNFLVQWATAIAILAALGAFISGATIWPFRRVP